MKFQPITFIKGAISLDDCPEPSRAEVAFAGRSNVGKSSVINALTNRKNIAHTSNVPGKTRQMNYYEVGDELYFVDLPGYGFAKVPEEERKKWGQYIRNYLMNRSTLLLTLMIIDARHKPTKLDEQFMHWMASNRRPFAVVPNKVDKISNNKQRQSEARLKSLFEDLNIDVPYIMCSTKTKKGIKKIQSLIRGFLNEDFVAEVED